jgi:ABC-type lipoprotein export system ATPase subunit
METQVELHSKELMHALNLYSIYRGKEGAENVVALRGINLHIDKGEFISVVGSSGAGKSTLLRVLGGLQKPSAGSIRYFGQNITNFTEDQLVPFRRDTIGFIFQEGNLLPSISAYQNVFKTLRYSGIPISKSKNKATEILDKLGIKHRMHDLPHKLSGGERQRVAIARAMVNNPKLILADEPTGNLDYENADLVMGLFKDLHTEVDTSFFVVTHSQHVASFASRTLELSDGLFVGQHGIESDIYKLEDSRSVIISEDGNLTIPTEMLNLIYEYGNLWEFKVNTDNDVPKIIGNPKSKAIENCPVCGAEISNGKFFCNFCGAKLK